MANISQEVQKAIENLEKASDGSAMRKAIIDALNVINENGGNATTLNGLYSDQLADKSEYFLYEFGMLVKMLNDFDTVPTKNRIALIPSGNMLNYLNTLHDRLKSINGGQDTKDSQTIAAALRILNKKIKEDIAAAIVEKGGEIDPLDSFEDYADEIKKLKIYDIVNELTVTQNTGDTPIEADPGKGWNVVHVNVQPRVVPLLATEERDYNVEDYPDVDAWNPVTIQVAGLQSESGSTGYKPGSSGSGSSVELEHMDITSNGSYTATGGKAIGSVYVEVNEPDINRLALEKFTVQFQDYDGSIIDEQHDVRGGSAVIYQGSKMPSKNTYDGTIWTFSHWDPSPDFIDRDMVCIAQFTEARYGDADSLVSWEEICNGEDVPVGTIKVLNFMPYNGIQLTQVRMKCVSKDEMRGNTWVSMDLINHKWIQQMCGTGINCMGTNGYGQNELGTIRCGVNPCSNYYVGDNFDNGTYTSGTAIGNRLGWLNSPLRVWLNTEFLNNCIPQMIRENIKPVSKTFYTIWSTDTQTTPVKDAFETMLEEGYGRNLKDLLGGRALKDGTNTIFDQYVWIPSTREIWRAYSKDSRTATPEDLSRYSENRSWGVENDGVIYDQAYSNVVDFTELDWQDHRKDVIKDIFTQPGQYEILKHLYYYPYDDFIEARRPFIIYGAAGSSWSGTYSYTETIQPREWPTRTCYAGDMFSINPYGSSKANMANAVDSIIPGNLSRLTTGPWVYIGNMARPQPIGICFGFVI